MKVFVVIVGTLFSMMSMSKAENFYAVPLSNNEVYLGVIELPATITGRVSSASSSHIISFHPRTTYAQKKAAIYTNTGTGMVFRAVLKEGEGDAGGEIALPYDNLTFSGSTTYFLNVSKGSNSPYEAGASYAVRLGRPDEVDKITVTFDGNSGVVATTNRVYELGKAYGSFPKVTRAGYELAGWSTAVTNGVVLSTGSRVSVGYRTLYAQWKVDPLTPTNVTPAVTNAYYVSFNANGGTGTMSNQTFAINVPQALAPNAFTRGGYEFRGWATSSTGSVTYVDCAVVSNLTTAGATYALYANWSLSSASITNQVIDGVTWYYMVTNGEATIQNVSGGVLVPAVNVSGRRDLTIPAAFGTNKVVKIGDWALSGCSSVTNIAIPLGVETIGDYAFAGCTSLSPGITIPESVTSLGAFVFTNCPALKIVRYLGNCPDADEKLYAGTPTSLISGVLRVRTGWEFEEVTATSSTSGLSRSGQEDVEGATADDEGEGDSGDDGDTPSQGGGSYAKWPRGAYARRVLPWVTQPVYRVVFWGIPGVSSSTISQYYIPGRELGSLPDKPKNADEREGYTFLGWFTKPYGGTEVTEEMIVGSSFWVYAHWRKDDEPENLSDVEYDLTSSYAYDGYLLDGAKMAGTIQLKTSKGRRNKEETIISATATITLLGEGRIRLKGTLGEDLTGTLVPSKSSDERELEVTTLSGSALEGTFGDYTVVGTRYIFGKKTYLDRVKAKETDDNLKGNYVVVLKSDPDESSLGTGYVGLSVQVRVGGRAHVAGTMPDGTKVSCTGRIEVHDGNVCELPVVVPLHTGKRGGFGFLMTFADDDVSVSAESDWVNPTVPFTSALTVEGAGWASALLRDATFSLGEDFGGVEAESDLLPSEVKVEVSGTRWVTPKVDRVKFNAEDAAYEVQTEYENPSGLSLSVAHTKGTFRGKFKVFAVTEEGKSKKYTAAVNGVVLDGVGYGSATIRKIDSVSVTVKEE